METATGPSVKQDALAFVRQVSAGLLAGAVSGLLIGGVGGRLAMFVLRLTSDPRLIGRETDDGFRIGEFTGDTMFLVLLAGAIGVLAGVFYLAIRTWLPAGARWLWFGLLGGIVGGTAIVHPGGIDFTVLGPLPLAIAMFVLIPGAAGAVIALLTERLLRPGSRFRSGRLWLLGLLLIVPLLIAGSVGLLIAIVATIVFFVGRSSPTVRRAASSQAATWVVRVALLAWGGYALVGLVDESVTILS